MNVFNNIKSIIAKYKENMPVIATAELLAEIDEAEADFCEWKQEDAICFFLGVTYITSCGHAEHYSTGIDKYCRHCGKPIKISEVE